MPWAMFGESGLSANLRVRVTLQLDKTAEERPVFYGFSIKNSFLPGFQTTTILSAIGVKPTGAVLGCGIVCVETSMERSQRCKSDLSEAGHSRKFAF